MVEISENILKNLKCNECGYYLSCFPIMININGDSACGKCSEREEYQGIYSIKNKAYEDLAKGVKFPCRYEKEGCQKKIYMNDIEKHEVECSFRTFKCPVLALNENCTVKCQKDNMLEHCLDHHPKFVLRKPYKEKLDLFREESLRFLVFVYSSIFVFEIKYSTVDDKIQHSVYLLGDPKHANMFSYYYELKSPGGIIKKDFEIQEESCIFENMVKNETKISSLVNILGNIEDIYLEVFVVLKEKKNEQQNPIYQTQKSVDSGISSRTDVSSNSSEFLLDDLKNNISTVTQLLKHNLQNNQSSGKNQTQTPINSGISPRTDVSSNSSEFSLDDLKNNTQITQLKNDLQNNQSNGAGRLWKCPYIKNGCCSTGYYNIHNLYKHERWFCEKSSQKCHLGCKVKLFNVSRFQHFIDKYAKGAYIHASTYDIGMTYDKVVKVGDVTFLCRWLVNLESTFFIYIVTDLDADRFYEYTCSVDITNVHSSRNVVKELNKLVWKNNSVIWDYCLQIDDFKKDNMRKYILTLKVNYSR